LSAKFQTNMTDPTKLSDIFIVIPAFNEQKRLPRILKDLGKTRFRIIVVDDGSTDGTGESLGRWGDILTISHKINLGKGSAMKTGCRKAFAMGAKAVIFMDADGQHRAQDLNNFTSALSHGYQVVFGSRNFGMGVPFVRYMGNKFASLLVSFLFGIYVSDLTCGYRGVTKEAFERINWESSGYSVETEMVIKAAKYKLKYCEVPVEVLYFDRVKGVTILDAFAIFFDVLRWRLSL